MLLQYGRLALNLLAVDAYERTAVMHGPNYLGTKHRITVTATFNPATQRDVLAGDVAPVYGPGNSLGTTWTPVVPATLPPPVGPLTPSVPTLPPLGSQPGLVPAPLRPGAYTATSIKHDLMQPRQALVFSVGGVVLLQSPLPGFDEDVAHGPIPVSCDVTQMMGTRTFKVRFVIETAVNEAPLRGVSSSNVLHAVLSHRWSMTHSLDQDFFLKRTIAGRLVFRSDVLNDFDLDPDDFRRYFFHPIPTGFKREGVTIKALDGQEEILDYEVVDRQLPVGWQQANVTRVVATHRAVVEKPNTEQTIAAATLEAARLIALPQVPGVGDISHTAIALGLVTAKTIYDLLPVMQHSVVVEVWGNSNSDRQSLHTFAENIASTRIGILVAATGAFLGGARAEAIHHAEEKHVLYAVTYTTGPLGTIALAVGQLVFGTNLFGNTDDTGTLLQVNATPGGPPDDGLGRGTYLEVVVAGALTGDAATGAQAEFNPPAPGVRATAGQAPTTDF